MLGLVAAAHDWPITAALALNFAVFMLAARRLHDMGRSGWWIALIPAGQVAVAFVAHFARLPERPVVIAVCAFTTATIVTLGTIAGDRGPNRFGQPPGRSGAPRTSAGA